MPSRQSVIIDLVRRNDWRMGVELGVFRGDTFGQVLEACPNLQMLGVDTWKAIVNGKSVRQCKESGHTTYTNIELAEARRVAEIVVKRFPGRGALLVMDTAMAAWGVPAESCDFVFIDADHRTASVVADIESWRSKVKSDGMLLGHDADWPSVRRALWHCFGTHWDSLQANMWMARP